MFVVEEEIFAISYHTIKIERMIDLEPRKINGQPVFGQPRRVKRHHLGLGAEVMKGLRKGKTPIVPAQSL